MGFLARRTPAGDDEKKVDDIKVIELFCQGKTKAEKVGLLDAMTPAQIFALSFKEGEGDAPDVSKGLRSPRSPAMASHVLLKLGNPLQGLIRTVYPGAIMTGSAERSKEQTPISAFEVALHGPAAEHSDPQRPASIVALKILVPWISTLI
ncbi:hypothetical protein HDU90_007433 [Geranomyces variabilis]|nr:hypothetical protein HDU90_007433 [Geranomyces variabilis]